MGLDMYLSGKRYLSSYNDQDKPIKTALNKLIFGEDFELNPHDNQISVNMIVAEVAYWRKANSIHRWFVNRVQNGQDDCGEYYVSRESLCELLDDCREVLENREQASEILPTKDGFFFGNTEYDDWYFSDIEYTVKTLEKILNDNDPVFKEMDFYYHASW